MTSQTRSQLDTDKRHGSPLVAIVVIGYNQKNYIERALRSVLGQSHRHLQCVFVDDGSKDNTLSIAQQIAETDSRLKVVHQGNAGPSSARRTGASQISEEAEFIGFLDGDDIYFPDFIAECLSYLQQNPCVDVVIPGFEYIDAQDRGLPTTPRTRWAPSKYGLPGAIPQSQRQTPFICFYCGSGGLPFWLASRRAYSQIDGWDVGFWPYEDTDILAQFALRFTVHTLSTPLVGFRVHTAQSTKQGSQRSSHWKDNSLDLMQTKWNRQLFDDMQHELTVERACRYYRRVHLPVRSLYIAKMAWADFKKQPSWPKMRWLIFLVSESVRVFLYFRLFFWRARRSWTAPIASGSNA